MVIAALVIFGALLAAWLLAPTERARVAREQEQHSPEAAPTMAEGLPEAA